MASTTLFNDPTLSDVKIIQTHDGKTREYFGHKAVLCFQSAYFMKAFTGSFKEASEGRMTLQDDNPVHFEFALKFMYTLDDDTDAIATILGDRKGTLEGFEFAMGVFQIADKYDIRRLIEPALADIQRILDAVANNKTLVSIVSAFYETSPECGHRFAKLIVNTIFLRHHHFMSDPDFTRLCEKFPVFAVDTMTSFARIMCLRCDKTIVVTTLGRKPGSTYKQRCPYCEERTVTITV